MGTIKQEVEVLTINANGPHEVYDHDHVDGKCGPDSWQVRPGNVYLWGQGWNVNFTGEQAVEFFAAVDEARALFEAEPVLVADEDKASWEKNVEAYSEVGEPGISEP